MHDFYARDQNWLKPRPKMFWGGILNLRNDRRIFCRGAGTGSELRLSLRAAGTAGPMAMAVFSHLIVVGNARSGVVREYLINVPADPLFPGVRYGPAQRLALVTCMATAGINGDELPCRLRSKLWMSPPNTFLYSRGCLQPSALALADRQGHRAKQKPFLHLRAWMENPAAVYEAGGRFNLPHPSPPT
jgi:hypothetical protein